MTLTTILPTLRKSIPDPFRPSAWPEYTRATTSDVIIAGVSLLRLVELCDSPCVHTADALVPGSHTKAALRRDASVVVVTVVDVVDDGGKGERVASIDAELGSVTAMWEETRLIGRVSTAAARPIVLAVTGGATPGARAWVPADLTAGDRLAIPCTGTVALHDIRRGPVSPATTDDPPYFGICGK